MNLTVEQIMRRLQELPPGAETNVSHIFVEPSKYAGRPDQVVLWPADHIYDHTEERQRKGI